ncbi:MAG: shikimate dehydrogenase [Clostridiales bacterium]|nr:shikimate dehydrogenase [Clostridiales bacterium]
MVMYKKYGLLGANIAYSFSPDLHNQMFQLSGIKAEYSLIDIPRDEFGLDVVSKAVKFYSGFNVTIPYKEAILGFLDEVDERARKIGAVNTVVLEDGKWKGYNTDYDGFIFLFNQLNLSCRRAAIILGTGGAAKMVYQALVDLGFENIMVVTRSTDSELSYFNKAKCLDYAELEAGNKTSDLLVNCTPIGMSTHVDVMPVSSELISRQGAVLDLIYNPPETRLMREASKLGIKVLGGLDMLIVQALEAERLWTGREMNVENNRTILMGMFR